MVYLQDIHRIASARLDTLLVPFLDTTVTGSGVCGERMGMVIQRTRKFGFDPFLRFLFRGFFHPPSSSVTEAHSAILNPFWSHPTA